MQNSIGVHLPIQQMWRINDCRKTFRRFVSNSHMRNGKIIRPRFRHRNETLFLLRILLSFVAVMHFQCMCNCTPTAHFAQRSIDVNRTSRSSDSLCNVLFMSVTFLLFFNFKYHQFHICTSTMQCTAYTHVDIGWCAVQENAIWFYFCPSCFHLVNIFYFHQTI